jgi:hypothetical protein
MPSRWVAAGAIDFAVFCCLSACLVRQVWQAVAAGAIDFAVFCCLSACLVRLRVSQLRKMRQVRQVNQFGGCKGESVSYTKCGGGSINCDGFGRYIKSSGGIIRSQSVISVMCGGRAVKRGVCGRAGKSIEAVASYMANQTVGRVRWQINQFVSA